MKEKNDVMPEHSPGMNLVPQIMSNQAESFLHTVEKLKVYGYEEVNLNPVSYTHLDVYKRQIIR